MYVIGVSTLADLNKGYAVRLIESFYYDVDNGRADTVFYLASF
jgi:hypothetical protein